MVMLLFELNAESSAKADVNGKKKKKIEELYLQIQKAIQPMRIHTKQLAEHYKH